jgi:hypothetical protein
MTLRWRTFVFCAWPQEGLANQRLDAAGSDSVGVSQRGRLLANRQLFNRAAHDEESRNGAPEWEKWKGESAGGRVPKNRKQKVESRNGTARLRTTGLREDGGRG